MGAASLDRAMTPRERFTERVAVWRERIAPAEPFLGLAAFLGGFAWDALTLSRVDRLTDHLILGGYLIALIVAMALEQRSVADDAPKWIATRTAWWTYAAQFCVGGLFSCYVVYFGRAATFGPSWVFVTLLVALMLANEWAHHLFRRDSLRLAIFWLLAFAFLRALLPVLFPAFGLRQLILTLPGATLLTAIAWLAMVGRRFAWRAAWRPVLVSGALATVVGGLDAFGFIPPLPLAVMEIGVFHQVEPHVNAPGSQRATAYVLTYERPPWWAPWRDDDHLFHWRTGDAASVFTAVFAPSGATLGLVHRWDHWDDATHSWKTLDTIDVTSRKPLTGGADLGFRTWSRKERLLEGWWRVVVVTKEESLEIGRTSFYVEATEGDLPFVTRAWD